MNSSYDVGTSRTLYDQYSVSSCNFDYSFGRNPTGEVTRYFSCIGGGYEGVPGPDWDAIESYQAAMNGGGKDYKPKKNNKDPNSLVS